jgi:hypothetical protein
VAIVVFVFSASAFSQNEYCLTPIHGGVGFGGFNSDGTGSDLAPSNNVYSTSINFGFNLGLGVARWQQTQWYFEAIPNQYRTVRRNAIFDVTNALFTVGYFWYEDAEGNVTSCSRSHSLTPFRDFDLFCTASASWSPW